MTSAPTSYVQLTPTRMRAEYATLTDSLIYRIEQELAVDDDRPLALLFLDKSARPVAWLVRALWPVLARQVGTSFAEGNVPPMPPVRFANIDREQWWEQTGASETGNIDVGRVDVDVIAGLRAAFLLRDPGVASPWDLPAFLDDRRILVIDEVSNTGDTLTIARGLVERAFPTSTVSATHWMSPGVTVDSRSGQRRTASVPVWYRSDTETGRLIGNRLATGRGSSWRGQVGRYFLSSIPLEQDERGLELRREVDALARDVAEGRLLMRPSVLRDDTAARVHGLYGDVDLREFAARREAQADLY